MRRALRKQGLTLSKVRRGPNFALGPYCVSEDGTGLVTSWGCSLEELELEQGCELPAGDRRSAI